MAREYCFAYRLGPQTPTRRFWTPRKTDAVQAAKELKKQFIGSRVAVVGVHDSQVAYEYPNGAAAEII